MDETGEVFSDKLKAYTLELVDYRNKTIDYPRTRVEYWLYNLVNMENMTTQLPFQAQQPIFGKVGGISELVHMNQEDRARYMNSLNAYRTNVATMEYAKEEAMEEGIEKGIEIGENNKAIAIAKNLLQMNLPIDQVASATGLSIEEIEKL